MKIKLLVAGLLLHVSLGWSQQPWQISQDSIWKGAMGMTYKLGKDCSVSSTLDGVSWSVLEEKMWQDKNRNWIKLQDNRLFWSSDRNLWNAAEKWMDIEGRWFMISASCELLSLPMEERVENTNAVEKRSYRLKVSKAIRSLEKQIMAYKPRGRVKRKYRPVVQELEERKSELRSKWKGIYKTPDAHWEEYKKLLDVMLLNPRKV